MPYEPFSVCMSVYSQDNPEWFILAVESVLNQTVPPAEIVLVVDGPVPEKMESVISTYEQNPIMRVMRFAENQGLGNARKAGMAACSYELIALMDADDISINTRFEQQLDIHAAHRVDVVGGDISEFTGDAENIVGVRVVPETNADIREYMKRRCGLNHVTVMFRKSAVMAAGGYIDWHYNEDYYLWLRMILNGALMMNTGTVLVNVRVGEEMYRRRGGCKYFLSEARLQGYMLRHHFIGLGTYLSNVLKRFIVQVLLPNGLRGWVFKNFARQKA